jgi:hypothetical protein
MIRQLSVEQVRHLRLLGQGLHPEIAEHASDIAQIVGVAGGLQAQEYPSAVLGVRARSHGMLAADVHRAREEERSIVLTWAMRGTLHLVPSADLGWLLGLLGPLFIHGSERRYRQLGLSAEVRADALEAIQEILGSRGPLTRPALAEALEARGIPVEGQAIAYLVSYAALEGAICLGPEDEGTLTYVLVDEWLKNTGTPPGKDGAVAALARRYFGGFGPATRGDFAGWSGLPVEQAQGGMEAIKDELVEVEALGETAWLLKDHLERLDWQAGEAVTRLLPRYDNYLLGYGSRTFMVDEAFAKRLHPGGGVIYESAVVNGRAIGTWRKTQKKGQLEVAVELFEPVDDGLKARVEVEGHDIGRFLGQDAQVTLTGPGTYP